MIIVGCPCKNDVAGLKMMYESLKKSTDYYDQIYIVNPPSTDGSNEYCDYLAKTDGYVCVDHTDTKSPLEAYTVIFKHAIEQEADLLLTQTDVIFPNKYKADWLDEMKKISIYSDDVGAATTLNGGRNSGPDYIDGMYWLGGWCTFIPYKTLKLLGGFDINFPNGFGVDIDYTYRLYKAGLKIAALDYWVDHHMQNTREHDTNEKSEEMKQASSVYFKKKWGLP